AVATGLVLQVVEPHLNGPGGEVPVIGFDVAGDGVFVLSGQGPAPAAATIDAYTGLGLDLVPGTGLLAACVPAAFGTWMRLLEQHGTLPLREVIQYAIGYARDGYPMLPTASAAIAAVADTFRADWPTSAEIYLASGVPAPGSRFTNKPLADCYSQILAEAEAAGPDRSTQIEAARRAFYEGFVADAIVAYLEHAEVMDITGRRHLGLLTGQDLAGWRASTETPVTLDYGDLTVCKTGPWGQGPVFLQQLALLRGFDLTAMGQGSADFMHTVVECAKLAFADREAWYGDPEFTDVPLDTLLSAGYADERRKLAGPLASGELRPGAPDGAVPALPGYALAAFSGGPALAAAAYGPGGGEPTVGSAGQAGPALPQLGLGDTCHLDVADRFGNLVSATPSGGWLQSSPVIPGLGFCLGSRAQMFTLSRGFASSLAPGRRPRTTLSPSLALRGGEPYLAFGTPGGDQQDQWTLAFFLNHVVFGMNLQEAIDAPEFHTDHFPSSFYPRPSVPKSLS
ncbi:MAG: gamma-glutamyltransferase, partial [Actinomycetota bacterium]